MLDEEYNTRKCTYCGEDATTKDHIIPVSFYTANKRSGRNFTPLYNRDNLVDSCQQCNSIAGNKIFDNVDEKRDFIQQRLTFKYKKLIDSPFWSKKEINEMSGILKKEIRIQQLARLWILNRINYPVEIYPVVKLNKQLKHFLEKQFKYTKMYG